MWGVFLVIRPNPTFALCPIFVHPLFPVFEPHIQKWVIFVRRRPCVCDTFRFESPPSPEKDRFWHRFPPLPPSGLRQLTFPNVKNDAGQKQYSPCFLRRRRRQKAGDAFTRTRLHASAETPAEGPKVEGLVFRVFECLGVFRCSGCLGFRVSGCLGCSGCSVWGLVIGFNFGVWPDENDPKCTMGFDSGTFNEKILNTS